MLFELKELNRIFDMPKMGVLHVGAHEAEESVYYNSLGWQPVIWVEAQPNLVDKLRSRLDLKVNKIIQAAVWDTSGVQLNFNVSSNSQSSSLLALGTHSDDYPSIKYVSKLQVTTQRLDEILSESDDFRFINLDLQGVEGRAIRGLGTLLSKVDYIYTEVNKREVYVGCSLISDMDKLMKDGGFTRVATRWVPFKGWGDALYIRNTEPSRSLGQRFALIRIQTKYVVSRYFRAIFSSVFYRLKS